MIVELSFLTGRFHATPWGRHVNEAVPEWPPSPFRLVRALVDAWYRKHPDLAPATVERVLTAMATPPLFSLPRARASHTRSYLSQNEEDLTDTKLVFDGFAVLDRAATVLVGWPGVTLDPEAHAAAQSLLGSLNYFGRSESWIKARLVDDHEVQWDCVPLSPGPVPSGKEVVSVAGVVAPEVFAQRGFEVSSGGKGKAKSRRVPWLEALTWGSAEAIENTMNRPPALEPLFYLRDQDALNARPIEQPRQSTKVVEVVRFSAESRVRVPITEALRVGEQVRRNLMGALARVVGRDSITTRFSGKDADGRPARGHSHISILCLDTRGEGYIDEVVVSSPEPFTVAEQQAIDRLMPAPRRNGHPLVLTPLRYGSRRELLIPATQVESLTPFAPNLHWRLKRDGDLDTWLAAQLQRECELRGLPPIARVEWLQAPVATHRHMRWLDFRRARKDDAPQPAYGLRVTFESEVLTPFSLGYASHFGLGCFVKVRDSEGR